MSEKCSVVPNNPYIASVPYALDTVNVALERARKEILGVQMVSGGAAASQRDGAAATGAPTGGHLHHQAVCGGSH